MALLDFIQRLLGLQKPSAATAKERLQLVLAHDRSDLNPELLEQMRREILEVVQKYVEIDLEGGEVSLATEDRVTALVANLPIRRARLKPLAPPRDDPQPATTDPAVAQEVSAEEEGNNLEASPTVGEPDRPDAEPASPSTNAPQGGEPGPSPEDGI